MKISLNKVKNYAKLPSSISDQELIDRIGSRLVEIEEVIDLAPRYQGIYIVKVATCEPIPDTHLHLCRIDAGAERRDLAGDDGLIQVVCGAPNVHAGMLAVWIAPGSIVPETYGNENFKLGVRKLRGYESNGMLAGADELGFDHEHKSIAEIDPKFARPGDSFADKFDLNDIIIDVENKSLTHRPDCFGLIGFAREVAGIFDLDFSEPEIFTHFALLPNQTSDICPLSVKITDSALCPRYSCMVFDLPDNQPSKYLTPDAVFLAKSGMRAIDPIVDLTNLLMLETGQPLHAFDYDKLVAVGGSEKPQIIVRAARDGEELQLLDDKMIQCISDDILITSNNIPIALAGAMGGKNTEVDASTRRIVLESATFSLYHLRKTQMAHGIFSEAITRFTKGLPAAPTGAVLGAAAEDLGVQPLTVVDEWLDQSAENVVKITTDKLNQLLGTKYSAAEITKTLENVGFKVKTAAGDKLSVLVPEWRTDIHIPEDLIEEVGRLRGFDNIPLSLPTKSFVESEIDPIFQLKSELREILSFRLGLHELITYSFVSRSLIEKVNKSPDNCYAIVNSISPELEYFRPEIVPSLLDKVRENLKAGFFDFTLYEINQVSRRDAGLSSEQTPILKNHLGLVDLHDFYYLKALVLALFRDLKIPVSYQALSATSAEHHPYLEPGRSAELLLGDRVIGVFGEFQKSVLTRFKLDSPISGAEINIEPLLDAPRSFQIDVQISKFPYVERDFTFQVAADASFGRLDTTLEQVFSSESLSFTITPLSVYQSTPDAPTKNLSFRVRFSNPMKTLTTAEISAIIEKVNSSVAHVGAQII